MLPQTCRVVAVVLPACVMGAIVQAETIALYDATAAAVAPDPTSAAGGSWTIDANMDPNATPGPVIDGGIPAWRIEDLAPNRGLWSYRHALTPSETLALGTHGWEMVATLRVTNGGSNSPPDAFPASMFFGFVDATGRWDVYLDLTTDGTLRLIQATETGASILAEGGSGIGANDYRTVRVALAPGDTAAALSIDGIPLGFLPDSGIEPDLPAGMRWGAGSTAGDGAANFRRVELRVLPTPSAICLLGFVGMFTLRRSRHARLP